MKKLKLNKNHWKCSGNKSFSVDYFDFHENFQVRRLNEEKVELETKVEHTSMVNLLSKKKVELIRKEKKNLKSATNKKISFDSSSGKHTKAFHNKYAKK